MTDSDAPRTLANLAEAELRALIRSIVLEELARSVGGTSYVGDLYGFELGQRVVLSAKGKLRYTDDVDFEGTIVTPEKFDNERGWLAAQRDNGSIVVARPDELEAKAK